MKKNNLLLLILLFLFFFVFGCQTSELKSKPEQVENIKKNNVSQKRNSQKKTLSKKHVIPSKILYLKYNIHVRDNGRDLKAHYTNWIGPFRGHAIVPVNTKVVVEKWRQGFILKRTDTQQKIYFYFNRHDMMMSAGEYANIITSPEKVLISQFSNIDKKGIKRGKVYLGMSKKGVLAALGYPARHKTPSLKNRFWVYWKNKWMTRMIKFNNSGKVTSVVE